MKGPTYHKPLTGMGKPKRTEYNGRVYPSKAQAARAADLDLLMAARQVLWWLPEVPIMIGDPKVDKPYRVDFLVCERVGLNHHVHAEDVKGFITPTFRRHVRQWRVSGPFPLHVLRGGELDIIPGGAQRD